MCGAGWGPIEIRVFEALTPTQSHSMNGRDGSGRHNLDLIFGHGLTFGSRGPSNDVEEHQGCLPLRCSTRIQ